MGLSQCRHRTFVLPLLHSMALFEDACLPTLVHDQWRGRRGVRATGARGHWEDREDRQDWEDWKTGRLEDPTMEAGPCSEVINTTG